MYHIHTYSVVSFCDHTSYNMHMEEVYYLYTMCISKSALSIIMTVDVRIIIGNGRSCYLFIECYFILTHLLFHFAGALSLRKSPLG